MMSKHNHKKYPSGANIRAPKGFYFKIENYGNNNFYVRLYKRNARLGSGSVGHIYLAPVYGKKKWLATHSSLDDKYRGKGFGARMYARAIQFALDHGYRVRSSGGSSELAQRVWNGHYIRKWFRIKAKKNLSGAYCPSTWYAYPRRAS